MIVKDIVIHNLFRDGFDAVFVGSGNVLMDVARTALRLQSPLII